MTLLEPQHLSILEATTTFMLPRALRRGWYRLRLQLHSRTAHGVHKRGTITVGEGRFHIHWNERLDEDLIVRLDRPSSQIALTLTHAQGRLEIQRFTLRRVSSVRATARAVTSKLKLLQQFNCLGPVLSRGSRLLVRGEFGHFARKLMKGLPDSRVMKLETRRAEEAGAAWWRRRSMAPEQRAAFEAEAEAIAAPVPVAIILPVDATRVDHARQAAFSVLRQIYPHWQLRILWPNDNVPTMLVAAVAHDPRCRIVCGDGSLNVALQRAVAEVPCDLIVILSPDAELADEALLKIASIECAVRLGSFVIVVPMKALTTIEALEPMQTAVSVLRWAQSDLLGRTEEALRRDPTTDTAPGGFASDLAKPRSDLQELVIGLDGDCESSLDSLPLPAATQALHLAANVTGISGWDAVAFQMLRGLSRAGITVKRHPQALVKTHTLPPGLSFEESPRAASDPQLIVAAPFQVKQFAPDRHSAILTMWECDRLPESSVRVLNQARVVIVPSRWGEATFRASGVMVPIEVVPLGIDPLVFHPHASAIKDLCVFGTAGALGAGGIRKNLAMVIAAFQTAFPTECDVRLRIKITPNCPPLDLPDDERIDITRAVLPATDVANWNRSLTAYVNASFAEGFGLHLLEALACGVPLISTAASGAGEFFDAAVGYVVPHREVAVKNDYYHGHWYEPDREAMIESLRSVYRHRVEAQRLGAAAASRARGYTWRDTGRSLLEVLRRHGMLT